METEPKISVVEIIVLLFFGIIADLLSIIPVVNILVAIVMGAITQIYFRFKNVASGASLVGSLIELFPVLSVIPAHIASILLTIYIDRHPDSKLATTAEKVVAIKNPKGSLAKRAEIAPVTAISE